jgi:hypothetical protein
VSDPYQTGRVLAQTGLRTAGSDDGGATWHAIGVVFSARVPPVFAADGTIFAAGATGEVLASIDVGATWTPTPDPAERGGLLRASDGIAAVPAEPTVPAAPRSVPTIYAARTAVYRVRFRGVIPRLALPSGAVLRSDRRSVRVRVLCRERPVRYCGGRIAVRQHGREVGRTLFAVAPARTRRALIVTVPLEHAVRGAARLELSGSSPWASRVEVRRRLRLR